MKKLLLIFGILFANTAIHPMYSCDSDSSSQYPSAPLEQSDTKIIEVSHNAIIDFCKAKSENAHSSTHLTPNKFPLLSAFYRAKEEEYIPFAYNVLTPAVYKYAEEEYQKNEQNPELALGNHKIIGVTHALEVFANNACAQYDSNLNKAEQKLFQKYTDTAIYGLKQLGLMGTGVTLGSFLFKKNIFSSKSSAIVGSLIALIPSILTTAFFVKSNNSNETEAQKTVIESLRNQLKIAKRLHEGVKEYALLQESVLISSIENEKVPNTEENESSFSTNYTSPSINNSTCSPTSANSSSIEQNESSNASSSTYPTSSSTLQSSNRSFLSRILSYFGW